VTAARYLCLAVPLALVLAAGRAERTDAGRAGALLAFIAVAVGLAALQEIAGPAGWYTFAPVEGAFRGMPVDVWIGWSALWGAAPVLLRRFLPLPVTAGLLLWLDLVTMPALHPLVRLGPHWVPGELVGLAGVALPAQLLGRWSADRRHLTARVLLQVAVTAALVLWLVPTTAFELGDGSWARLTTLPAPWLFGIAQLALLLAVPALAAVAEFAVRGGGTPYPWDPPRRLVTTGPYAYIANPMQLSAVALLLMTAAVTASLSLAAAALGAAAFAAGLATRHEHAQLSVRYGADWHRYRQHVHNWWPRWRPYQPAAPASVWLDGDCPPCAATRAFLATRHPTGLIIAAAQEQPYPIPRAVYLTADGHTEHGTAAVARALEHVNLGCAYQAWLLRLPGINALAQLITDAMIAPPHRPARITRPQGAGCRTPDNDCSTERSPPSANTASPACPPAPSPPPPE
jgi:protein-S-isoprenylcysteine O-methyltransferase Ste14